MEYTIDEVVDFIIAEFDLNDLLLIEPDRRISLKQYIQNNLSKKNIPFVRQETDKKGKPKIYNQDSINQLIKYCGKYFVSLSSKTEDEKKRALEQYAVFKQSEESLYPPRSSDEEVLQAFKKPPMNESELYSQDLKNKCQSEFIDRYEKKKYQVMLEALFRQYFTLNESNLKRDVYNEAYYRVYDELNSDIIRSLSRLEDVTNYYKNKDIDEE